MISDSVPAGGGARSAGHVELSQLPDWLLAEHRRMVMPTGWRLSGMSWSG